VWRRLRLLLFRLFFSRLALCSRLGHGSPPSVDPSEASVTRTRRLASGAALCRVRQKEVADFARRVAHEFRRSIERAVGRHSGSVTLGADGGQIIDRSIVVGGLAPRSLSCIEQAAVRRAAARTWLAGRVGDLELSAGCGRYAASRALSNTASTAAWPCLSFMLGRDPKNQRGRSMLLAALLPMRRASFWSPTRS
jgi:hypothetical protein